MDFGARLSRLDSRRFEPSRLLVRGCRHEVREEAEEEKDVGREAGEREPIRKGKLVGQHSECRREMEKL